jgi:hypothetical protein
MSEDMLRGAGSLAPGRRRALVFVGGESAGLIAERVRNRDLADVVKQGGFTQPRAAVLIPAETLRNLPRDADDTFGMLACPFVACGRRIVLCARLASLRPYALSTKRRP